MRRSRHSAPRDRTSDNLAGLIVAIRNRIAVRIDTFYITCFSYVYGYAEL